MRKRQNEHRKEVYEIAIQFARIWGVTETLEPLPNLSFDLVRDMVVAWAEEFSSGPGGDPVDFFNAKVSDWKKEQH